MKKAIIISIGVIAVLAGMAVVLMNNKKKIDEKNQPIDRSNIPVTVSVAAAKMSDLQGAMSFSGMVEAAADADVSVSGPGTIKTLSIAKGQYVRKGQVLGTVDSEQMRLQLKSLELAETKLTDDLARVRTLVQGNAAPENNLRELDFNLSNTKIQIEQLKQRIVDNNIVAPISGMVTFKNMEAGEFASPGMLIAKIVDVSNLKVAVFVNEKHIYRVADKQAASVTTDAMPGKTFKGVVTYISPVGVENHNYRVEVQLDAEGNTALKAGTFTLVNLGTTEAGRALTIPAMALMTETDGSSVFVVSGETVKRTPVTVGRREGDLVEVIGGVKEGEQVVVAGQINLIDGAKISISKD